MTKPRNTEEYWEADPSFVSEGKQCTMIDIYSEDLKLGEHQIFPNVSPARGKLCMKIYASHEKYRKTQQKTCEYIFLYGYMCIYNV